MVTIKAPSSLPVNAVQESHTKHINIHYHYIRELVVAKEVEL